MTKLANLNKAALLASVSALLGMGASGAAAQESAANAAADEIVVIGKQFVDLTSTGATKLPLAIDEIPQSIGLIGEEFIDVAEISKLEEIADYAAGLTTQGTYFGTSGVIKSRGFMLTEYGFRVDGFRIYDPTQINAQFLDRIEIVRGPSSVVYGIGNPGGLVNFILKQAPDEGAGHIELRAGRFKNYEGYADYGGPINDRVRAFGAVSYSTGEQFTNFLEDEDLSLMGSAEVDISDTLQLSLVASHSDSTIGATDGIPLFNDGSAPDVPRGLLVGDPRLNRQDRDSTVFISNLKYQNSSGLSGSVNFAYDKVISYLGVAYPFDLTPAGDTTVYAFARDEDVTVYNIEGKVQYDFDFFGQAGNSILFSIAYDNFDYMSDDGEIFYNGAHSIPVNIFSGQDAIIHAFMSAGEPVRDEPGFQNVFETKQLTGTVQALLRPLPRAAIIAGVSLNDSSQSNTLFGEHVDYGKEISLRFGATYEILDSVNVYGSYSESFQPQNLLDINDHLLPPITGTQYEAGVKANLFGQKLLLTAAYFDITQANSPLLIPLTIPERYEAIGEVSHKGFELEAVGKITPTWAVLANFSYLDASVSKSSDPAEVGLRRPFIAKTNGAIFSTYEIPTGSLAGLGFGGGLRFSGSLPTSSPRTTLDVDGHVVVDAVVYYARDSWELRLNAKNIFNEDYRLATYDDILFGLHRGEPTTVVGSVSVRF